MSDPQRLVNNAQLKEAFAQVAMGLFPRPGDKEVSPIGKACLVAIWGKATTKTIIRHWSESLAAIMQVPHQSAPQTSILLQRLFEMKKDKALLRGLFAGLDLQEENLRKGIKPKIPTGHTYVHIGMYTGLTTIARILNQPGPMHLMKADGTIVKTSGSPGAALN